MWKSIGLAILMCLAGVVCAGELNGELRLRSGGSVLRASESQEAVIYFRSKQPVVITPRAEPYLMSTRRKQFVPRVLAIGAGETVRFPNDDPILHNVFSASPENAFDTGQYGRGEGKTTTFNKPGLVRVYCNVHHSMFGFVLVLDTPFHTRPDALGRFKLTGLPEGEGELVIFHDRGAPLRQKVFVAPDAKGLATATKLPVAPSPPLALTLELNRRKVPVHSNKFGKPYARSPNAAY
jgi:plastocyanin